MPLFLLVQAHAARTQHSNFSESTDEVKPLTAEEKLKQLARYLSVYKCGWYIDHLLSSEGTTKLLTLSFLCIQIRGENKAKETRTFGTGEKGWYVLCPNY